MVAVVGGGATVDIVIVVVDTGIVVLAAVGRERDREIESEREGAREKSHARERGNVDTSGLKDEGRGSRRILARQLNCSLRNGCFGAPYSRRLFIAEFVNRC